MGKGHGFELDITMSTSNKPKLAGKMSDMYLVPSLTVLFMKSMVVEFNTKTCKGQAEEKWTWSLKKGEAKNTFSWLSHYELIHTQLVTMNSALSKEKTKLAAERNPIKKKEVKKKVDKLESGLIGWAKVMSQNQKTHDAAKDGSLPKVFAYKKGYYSGLMPENLINKAQKVTGSFTPKEGDAQSSNSFLKGAIGLANKYVGYLPGGAFDKKKVGNPSPKKKRSRRRRTMRRRTQRRRTKRRRRRGSRKKGESRKPKRQPRITKTVSQRGQITKRHGRRDATRNERTTPRRQKKQKRPKQKLTKQQQPKQKQTKERQRSSCKKKKMMQRMRKAKKAQEKSKKERKKT